MKKGILYGIGVGPGDPELLTLRAVRIMQESDFIAGPKSGDNDKTAFAIAADFIKEKPILYCDMPMVRDKAVLNAAHDKATDDLCALLDQGKTIAFLTLGDPSIYSTYWYVHKRVLARGYDAFFVPGVPSFCAAAAAMNIALCEGSEMLHIIPASHESTEEGLTMSGTKVLMKAGRAILDVRDRLQQDGKLQNAALVERVGMKGERIVHDLGALNDPTGYFSIIVVKEDEV